MVGVDDFVRSAQGVATADSVHEGEYIHIYEGKLADENLPVRLLTLAPTVDDEDGTEAFRRTASAWANAQAHPSIVSAYAHDSEPRPWIAVENVDGDPLDAAQSDLSVSGVKSVIEDVAEGLRNAALYNTYHLDLRPDTVWVASDDERLLGLVDEWGLERAVRTAVDDLKVTPFTAPELVNNPDGGTEQTDVYGLGALAYFGLTGQPPITADVDLTSAITNKKITPPGKVSDSISTAVDAVVMEALATDPSNRQQSVYSFKQAFTQALTSDKPDGQNIGSSIGGQKNTAATASTSANIDDNEEASEDDTAVSRRAAIGILGLGSVGLGGGWVAAQVGSDNSSPPPRTDPSTDPESQSSAESSTEPSAGTETNSLTRSATNQSREQTITRVNSAGEEYQTGYVTSAPEKIEAGEAVSVTIEVETLINAAEDNVVFGAIGAGKGTVYEVAQISENGSGIGTVEATIPSDVSGEIYWTWVPALSDQAATEKAAACFEFKHGSNLPDDAPGENLDQDGRLAYSLSTGGAQGQTATQKSGADEEPKETTTQPNLGDEYQGEAITRVNSAGREYQTGSVTSVSAKIDPGGSISVTIEIDALIDAAEDNIVYGAVGAGNGTVYEVTQMPGSGSGTVTVETTIPSDASSHVYWTWVPALSDQAATKKAGACFEYKQGSELPQDAPGENLDQDGQLTFRLDPR